MAGRPPRGRRTVRAAIITLALFAVFLAGRQSGRQQQSSSTAPALGGGGSTAGGRKVAEVSSRQQVLAGRDSSLDVQGAISTDESLQQPQQAEPAGASGGITSALQQPQPSQQSQPAQAQADFAYDPSHQPRGFAAVKDAAPPKRRRGFKAAANGNQAKYDQMWTGAKTYQKGSCWGCRFVGDVVTRLNFTTVLDAGTGNGGSVRAMRLRGKAAWGVELSQAVLDQDAPDLLAAGVVEQGSLTNLPYEDGQFDLVFSADVLEHIMPDEADAVVAELVRVARRHIVMSISLKSYQNTELHTLLRPREWWEAKFAKHGARPNRALVWALQQRETRFVRSDYTQCKREGSQSDGGLYEVCVVQMPWLVGRPGQELRQHRCITTENSELEPWMFAFTKG